MTRTLRLGAAPGRDADPEQIDTEVKMRRALGLPTGPRVPGAERNVERGAAPSRTGRNRLAELEEALEAEQRTAVQAKREVEAARTAHKDLETRLHHITLARDEALEALETERKARQDAEEKLLVALSLTESAARTEDAASTEPPAPRRRGRPPGRRQGLAAAAEPDGDTEGTPETEDGEPVQWWVPGWQKR